MNLTDEDCECCFDLTELANALDAAGVYAILNEDNNVIYVGESENIFRRICEHITNKGQVPRRQIVGVAVLAFEEERIARLSIEEHNICKFSPRYNYANKRMRHLRRGTDNVDPYRRRELAKHGLATVPDNSLETLESPNEGLEAELRYIDKHG